MRARSSAAMRVGAVGNDGRRDPRAPRVAVEPLDGVGGHRLRAQQSLARHRRGVAERQEQPRLARAHRVEGDRHAQRGVGTPRGEGLCESAPSCASCHAEVGRRVHMRARARASPRTVRGLRNTRAMPGFSGSAMPDDPRSTTLSMRWSRASQKVSSIAAGLMVDGSRRRAEMDVHAASEARVEVVGEGAHARGDVTVESAHQRVEGTEVVRADRGRREHLHDVAHGVCVRRAKVHHRAAGLVPDGGVLVARVDEHVAERQPRDHVAGRSEVRVGHHRDGGHARGGGHRHAPPGVAARRRRASRRR